MSLSAKEGNEKGNEKDLSAQEDESDNKFKEGPNALADSKKFRGDPRPERFAVQCPKGYVKKFECSEGLTNAILMPGLGIILTIVFMMT